MQQEAVAHQTAIDENVDTVAVGALDLGTREKPAQGDFGGAAGLVTMEDIMEEVVEEMEDEYDSGEKPVQWVRKISKRDYMVSARIELDSLEEALGIQLPKGKYATLAGFLLEKSGEIPAPGTVIKRRGITFTVERSTPQAIQEVRVRW